ncbi:MAG: tetratricopeptide repeat protein [Proteobacteria bacterium]|nr:tetratricopeptide repeat protein [Pseudomonadota bacterium]
MASYETEEEQIEALKKWWKENGISVFGGIAIGFALLFGWRWWQAYDVQQSQMASDAYEHVLMSLEQKQSQQAYNTADKLLAEHSNSAYSIFAALNLVRQDVEDGELDSAHARLQWIIDQNTISELTHIARLRKAQIFISQDKLDEASNLLKNPQAKKFKGSYAELRGDIAMKQKDVNGARSAYSEAVESENLSAQHLKWVQMKLDDLGPAERINAVIPDNFGTPTTAEMVEKVIPVDISELATPQTTTE